MNVLLHLYPGDQVAMGVAIFLVQVAAIVTLGVAVARCFLFNPAIRHQVLLVTWLAIPTVLFVTVGAKRMGVGLVAELAPRSAAVPSQLSEELNADHDLAASIFLPSGFDIADLAVDAPMVADRQQQQTRFTPSDRVRASTAALFILWLAGSGVLAIRLITSAWRLWMLRRTMVLAAGRLPVLLGAAARDAGLTRSPRLLVSESITTPGVLGYLRPRIVLPARFAEELSDEQLRHILLHESAHLRRGDQWAVLRERVLRALLWPHPLVHVLHGSLSAAREELCDNFVLRSSDSPSYARTLVEIAEALASVEVRPLPVAFLVRRSSLESRVSHLLSERRKTMTKPTLATVLVSLAAATAITMVLALTQPTWSAEGPLQDVETPTKESVPDQPGTQDQKLKLLVAEYQQLSAQLKKVLAQIRELGGSVPNPPEDVPPDSENAPDEQPRLEVYSISTADPKTVRRALEEGFQDLISKKTGPHIQLEVSGKQLIARATPSQHRMIRELIKGMSLKQSDSGPLDSTQDTPKEQPFWGSYLISNADPDAVRRVLQTLFVGDVIVRVDGQGKLIALATPSQHREIKDAIKKMGYMMTDKPKSKEDIEVRVFQLRGQDAKTAMLTIEKLYGKAGPIVDGVRDPDLLVVRGTPSQLQEVEKLLPQLGVTKYRIDDSVAPGSSTPDVDIVKRLKRLEAAVEKLLKANE